MNDRNQVRVWKAYSFNEISSRNLACVVVYGNGAIFEEIVQIETLQYLAAIKADQSNQVLVEYF